MQNKLLINLIDNNDKRMLDIFNILYNNDQFCTLQEISNTINVSKSTISMDIINLNNTLKSFGTGFYIKSLKSKGSILIKQPAACYSIYRNNIIKNTLNFQIIDLIFQVEDISIEYIINHLYLSQTTLYRKLNSIEIFLKNYGLKLNNNRGKLSITGEYNTLCEFYLIIYQGLYTLDQHPYINYSEIDIRLKISDTLYTFGYTISNTLINKLTHRIAIMLTLRKKGTYELLKSNKFLVDPIREDIFPPIINNLLSKFPPIFSIIEKQNLMLTLCTIPFFNDVLFDHKKVVTYLKKQNNFKVINCILIKFDCYYPEINILSNTTLYYQFSCILNYVNAFNELSIDSLPPLFNEILQNKYSSLFSIIDIIFFDIKVEFNLNNNIRSLFTFYMSKIILSEYPNYDWNEHIYIYVHSSEDVVLERVYINLLSDRLKKEVIYINSVQLLHLTDAEISKIKLIISDTYLYPLQNNFQVQYYYFHPHLPERDLSNIEQLITNLERVQ